MAAERDIHIWLTAQDELAARLPIETALGFLDARETARAERLRSRSAWARFVRSHGYLRTILAAYLDTAPQVVAFRITPAGKPKLSVPLFQRFRLRFNLSHSDRWVAVALSWRGLVGVDVEDMAALERMADLDLCGLTPVLTREERAKLRSLGGAAQRHALLMLWTRKEAIGKALGRGLDLYSARDDATAPSPAELTCLSTDWPKGSVLSCATTVAQPKFQLLGGAEQFALRTDMARVAWDAPIRARR